MKKPYCTQNDGKCSTCSLVNYNRDCQNNPIHGGKRPGAGRPATGAKPSRTFRLDDDEYKKVKEFIKRLRSDNMIFNKTFTTYSPENYGLESGSNNGNYAEYAEFKITSDGRYFIKYSDSSEGDLSPHSEWHEMSLGEWLEAYAKAAIDEHVDFECHAPEGDEILFTYTGKNYNRLVKYLTA